jgi:hypothetical protein
MMRGKTPISNLKFQIPNSDSQLCNDRKECFAFKTLGHPADG